MKRKKRLYGGREDGWVLINKLGRRKFNFVSLLSRYSFEKSFVTNSEQMDIENVNVNSAILRIINKRGLLREASLKYINYS